MVTWAIYTVEITSAAVSDLLTLVNKRGFCLSNIHYIDELRIQVVLPGTNIRKFRKLINEQGGTMKIVSRCGMLFALKRMLQRPIMLMGFLLWFFLLMYLPTRVLFIYVEGNNTVDDKEIIEAAERSGVCFGASRRYVRSESVKNNLLSEISTLQWAGINTYGCVAVISVKERSIPQYERQEPLFGSIVAMRDGIISQITVTSGNKLCDIGQAVRKEQVLVSGYTDCGIHVRAERAEAEIFALTNRHVQALTPTIGIKRLSANGAKTQYSIQIGKKIINLYKYSRIPDRECVKMYSQNYLTLPGGFELPISLITERICIFEEQPICISDIDATDWMEDAVRSYLVQDMVAGRILRTISERKIDNGLCYLKGSYICNEIIGKLRIEMIGEKNE